MQLSRCQRRKSTRLRKLEVDRDVSLEVGGFTVVPVGLVAPLLHCALGCLSQNRISRDQRQRIDLALLVDDHLQRNAAVQFLGERLLWVGRMDAVNQLIVCKMLWN